LGSYEVMPIRKYIAGNFKLLAKDAFGRKSATVNRGSHVFDNNSAQSSIHSVELLPAGTFRGRSR
jgi:hypothetical protein